MFDIIQSPSPNYHKGRNGYQVKAIVDHITDGHYPGCLNWLRNPDSEVSAQYLITREGKIYQMVSVYDTAWANGRVNKPTWKGIIRKLGLLPVNPNYYTVSIEHEGFADEPLTEIQYQASLWLHIKLINGFKWTITKDNIRNYIIGHNQIYAKKPNCPGPKFPWARLYGDLLKRGH